MPGTLTDDQHDWLSKFTGIDTRRNVGASPDGSDGGQAASTGDTNGLPPAGQETAAETNPPTATGAIEDGWIIVKSRKLGEKRARLLLSEPGGLARILLCEIAAKASKAA
jgi:hypothetical protein